MLLNRDQSTQLTQVVQPSLQALQVCCTIRNCHILNIVALIDCTIHSSLQRWQSHYQVQLALELLGTRSEDASVYHERSHDSEWKQKPTRCSVNNPMCWFCATTGPTGVHRENNPTPTSADLDELESWLSGIVRVKISAEHPKGNRLRFFSSFRSADRWGPTGPGQIFERIWRTASWAQQTRKGTFWAHIFGNSPSSTCDWTAQPLHLCQQFASQSIKISTL